MHTFPETPQWTVPLSEFQELFGPKTPIVSVTGMTNQQMKILAGLSIAKKIILTC